MKYPATFTPDSESGGYVVTFRDIPEAITQGDSEEEAMEMAADALLTSMDFYFEDNRTVPMPTKAKSGERLVSLPAIVSAKVLLLNEMIVQKVGPSELARRVGTSPQVMTRVLDLGHATKIDTIAEALEALGRNLELSIA